MSRPLLGGSAVVVALLSASFLFYARPSVAETLAATPSQQVEQRGDTQIASSSDADASPVAVTLAETSDAANGKERTGTTSAAVGKPETAEEAETTDPVLTFTATAYSLRGRTASGKMVARGLIAADRRILPIGTRVRLEAGSYSGEYLVADTGGAVRGRKIDIWMPSTSEAMRFGRRPVKITVLTRTRPRTVNQRAGK